MDSGLIKEEKFNIPRFIIAAPQGRSGKTLASIFLCAALKEKGLVVQPFKKGPDYIDPSWLTIASGRPCRNLDPMLMSEETLLRSFSAATDDAEIALIEGAMGMYDGLSSDSFGSTAYLAKMLHCPVILIVNCSRMTASVAAMINGYTDFDTEVNISGVILNNVSGRRHEETLKSSIEKYCDIPVVGVIHRDPALSINERHLGLVTSVESKSAEIVERIYSRLKNSFDIDEIIRIAAEAPAINIPVMSDNRPAKKSVKLGVLKDRVFSFYYPENLEALKNAGAEPVFINSMEDTEMPDIDGLYIGGGFPELYLDQLEKNRKLREQVKAAIEKGLPVYAECGGLMYLCKKIKWQNRWYEMAGAIDADIEISDKPVGHGYASVEITGENPFFTPEFRFWGHEFHYSRITRISLPENAEYAFKLHKGKGITGNRDGIVINNMLATYVHLHASGVPQWADSFVSLMLNTRNPDRSIAVNR